MSVILPNVILLNVMASLKVLETEIEGTNNYWVKLDCFQRLV
jgi:hypothetical protein